VNRSYIYQMIDEIIIEAESPNVWEEYEIKDQRGMVEVHFPYFDDFCEFVKAVECRGWVATITQDARRLLFGVRFDIPASDDHEGLSLFVPVRKMNATLQALKNSYPDVINEMNNFTGGNGKLWRNVVPPRWS